ncbi:MAG TPA: hypothetical protein VKU00_28065 [Chthonomonadaceae bacterium]|nr:hypothetical protein [Chthonomonadaceae bacterium]
MEKPKRATKAKLWIWWVIALLAAGAIAATLLHPQSERMLLERAKIVVPAPQFSGGDYQWLSNSNLLLACSRMGSDRPQQGLFYQDLETGLQTREPTLEAILFKVEYRRLMPPQYSPQISPDGAWLLSGILPERFFNKPGASGYCLCRTDGTLVRRQEIHDGFLVTRWLADGRHWIELYGRRIAPAGPPRARINWNYAPEQIQEIRVYDVDTPGQWRSIPIAASSSLSQPSISYTLFALTENHFLTWERTSTRTNDQVILRERDANSTVPLRQYTLTAPGGHRVTQILFSPHGDRILWKLSERRQASIISQMIQQVTHKFNAGTERVSLWVSRLDGSEMHEIGGVNNPTLLERSGPIDLETGEYYWGPPIPRQLRWSPDGKRISFTYNRAIWTVPAD